MRHITCDSLRTNKGVADAAALPSPLLDICHHAPHASQGQRYVHFRSLPQDHCTSTSRSLSIVLAPMQGVGSPDHRSGPPCSSPGSSTPSSNPGSNTRHSTGLPLGRLLPLPLPLPVLLPLGASMSPQSPSICRQNGLRGGCDAPTLPCPGVEVGGLAPVGATWASCPGGRQLLRCCACSCLVLYRVGGCLGCLPQPARALAGSSPGRSLLACHAEIRWVAEGCCFGALLLQPPQDRAHKGQSKDSLGSTVCYLHVMRL